MGRMKDHAIDLEERELAAFDRAHAERGKGDQAASLGGDGDVSWRRWHALCQRAIIRIYLLTNLSTTRPTRPDEDGDTP
jgi:hypothetical protein